MPRVHNIDIIQRTKHTRCNTNNSGGVFSLSTPFTTSQPKNNITVAPPSSMLHTDTTNRMHGTTNNNNDGDVDDMEFDATNNNQPMYNTSQQYQHTSTAKASHQNQSPNKSIPPSTNKSFPNNTTNNTTNTTNNNINKSNNQQYKDGLEADDDDSDATTCDGSVDLLADDSQPSNKQKSLMVEKAVAK